MKSYVSPWKKYVNGEFGSLYYGRTILHKRDNMYIVGYDKYRSDNQWYECISGVCYKTAEKAMEACDLILSNRSHIVFLTEEQAERYKILI